MEGSASIIYEEGNWEKARRLRMGPGEGQRISVSLAKDTIDESDRPDSRYVLAFSGRAFDGVARSQLAVCLVRTLSVARTCSYLATERYQKRAQTSGESMLTTELRKRCAGYEDFVDLAELNCRALGVR